MFARKALEEGDGSAGAHIDVRRVLDRDRDALQTAESTRPPAAREELDTSRRISKSVSSICAATHVSRLARARIHAAERTEVGQE
jgi:hypothetical protein